MKNKKFCKNLCDNFLVELCKSFSWVHIQSGSIGLWIMHIYNFSSYKQIALQSNSTNYNPNNSTFLLHIIANISYFMLFSFR